MPVYQNPELVGALREQANAGQIETEEVGSHLVVTRPNGARLCLRCNSRAANGELERIECGG